MSSKADQKILRTLLQTQTGKIGAKNEEDVALLASVADYFEKRAKIEADYGKALEKLARTHMERNNRRPPFGTISRAGSLLGLPGLGQPKADNMAPPSPDGFENDGATAQTTRSTHDAFLQFLRESERQADCRVKLAESLVKDISEVVKLYTPRKQSVAKKQLEYASRYHQDLLQTFNDVDQLKLKYEAAAREHDSLTAKYEAATSGKKSALMSLKRMMTSDADTQAKLSRKLKSATRQLVDARNYLVLALASLNAQQTAYYGEFLPSLLARVDGDFYDRLALFLKTYSDLETDFSAVLQSGIGVMVDSTAKITRDQDISLFRLKNGDLFDSRKPVAFEPAGNDQTNGIEVDDVSRVLLSSKLKGLIETEEDLIKQLNKAEKQLGGLRQIEDVLRKEPAYGDPSLSLEQVIEHEAAADNARLALASVRAQIALLRAAGVGLPKQAHGLRHNHDTPRSGGERAVALYPYAAQGPDELSLEEDDILDVIYVEEGGEWIKVRKGGETGMVPSSYVDIGGQPSSPAPSRGSKQSSNFDGEPNHGEEDTRSNWNGRGLGKVVAKYAYKATCPGELDLLPGYQIVVTNKDTGSDAWWEGICEQSGAKGQFPISYVDTTALTQQASRPTSIVSRTSNHGQPAMAPKPASLKAEKKAKFKVRALFDYLSDNADDLSFAEGAIIDVFEADEGDDWWKGSVVGGPSRTASFPRNYVERI